MDEVGRERKLAGKGDQTRISIDTWRIVLRYVVHKRDELDGLDIACHLVQ